MDSTLVSLFNLVDNDLKLVIDVVEVFYSFNIVEPGLIGSSSGGIIKRKTLSQLIKYFSTGVEEVIRVEDNITSSVNIHTGGDTTGFGSGSNGLTGAIDINIDTESDEIVTRNRNSSLVQVRLR